MICPGNTQNCNTSSWSAEGPLAPLTEEAFQGRLVVMYQGRSNPPKHPGERPVAAQITWEVAALSVRVANASFQQQRQAFPMEARTRERMIGYLAAGAVDSELPSPEGALT